MSEYRHFKFQVRNKSGMDFWLLDEGWKQVDHETINSSRAEQAQAGIACYPNGEILCKFGTFQHLPQGISFLIEPRPNKNPLRFDKKFVRNGEGGATARHTRSSSQTGDPRFYYATTITNLSSNRIRAVKFATFAKGFLGIKRDPSNGYYSAEQFQNWYGVSDPEGGSNLTKACAILTTMPLVQACGRIFSWMI